jgi:lactate permease
MSWTQAYDPLGHWWLSTLVAALPILVLLGLLAGLKRPIGFDRSGFDCD